MNEELTLRDAVESFNGSFCVELRLRFDDGTDTLIGVCRWDGSNLVSLDGDSYLLSTHITYFKMCDDGVLRVWDHW